MTRPEDGTTQDGASATGVYDYALRGVTNFAADRALVHQAELIAPGTIEKIRRARGFHLDTAAWSVRAQDVSAVVEHAAWTPGRGPSLHEVVRKIRPDTTVVYTQRSEVCAARLDKLAGDIPGVWSVHAATLPMTSMLPLLRAQRIIGEDTRTCLLLPMVLHFLDRDMCREIICDNAALLPSGSVIAVSMVMCESAATARRMNAIFPRAIEPYAPRDLAGWMGDAGLRLAGPGVTDAGSWSPEARRPRFAPEVYGRIAGAVGVVS